MELVELIKFIPVYVLCSLKNIRMYILECIPTKYAPNYQIGFNCILYIPTKSIIV